MAVSLALLGACNFDVSRVCVTSSAPSIRLPVVPGHPAAGSFEVEAPAGGGDLVSVTSDRIASIEMHQTTTAGGVTSMHRIQRIAADSCNRISTSDGRHLMLVGLDPSIRAGDNVALTFHFEHGGTQTISARVWAAGDDRGG